MLMASFVPFVLLTGILWESSVSSSSSSSRESRDERTTSKEMSGSSAGYSDDECYYCREQRSLLQCREIRVSCPLDNQVCTTSVQYSESHVTFSSGCIHENLLNSTGRTGCDTDGKKCWDAYSAAEIQNHETSQDLADALNEIINNRSANFTDEAIVHINAIYNAVKAESIATSSTESSYNESSSTDRQTITGFTADTINTSTPEISTNDEVQTMLPLLRNDTRGGLQDALRSEGEITDDDTVSSTAVVAGTLSAVGAVAAVVTAVAAWKRFRKKRRTSSQAELRTPDDGIESGLQPQVNNWIPRELSGTALPSAPPPGNQL